jgi:glycosyltransferase involved in cell wall biosynthesis
LTIPPSARYPSVSICFPAFNENATIRDVVEEAYELATRVGLDFELIVCDDGSSDGTADEIARLANRLSAVRVLAHPTNLGIRRTFEHLYSEATKEYVFLNSADRQWDTRVLLDMLPMTRDFDVIVAARRRKPYGLVRSAISWAFNVVPVVLFGVHTRDAGAVKLQRREIIDNFPLVSQSPFSEVERIVRATRAGYRYGYLQVDAAARASGRGQGANWRNVFAALVDVARTWWALNVIERRTEWRDMPSH